jgi:hypothetical protein
MPLSVNVFVTLATQQLLEYHCKALFETLCIIKCVTGFKVKAYTHTNQSKDQYISVSLRDREGSFPQPTVYRYSISAGPAGSQLPRAYLEVKWSGGISHQLSQAIFITAWNKSLYMLRIQKGVKPLL